MITKILISVVLATILTYFVRIYMIHRYYWKNHGPFMHFHPIYLEGFDYDETDECLVMTFGASKFMIVPFETPGSNYAIIHMSDQAVVGRARIPSRLGIDMIIEAKCK